MKQADWINSLIALGTLAAAYFAYSAARETREIAASSRVQQLQGLYLTYYSAALDGNKDAIDQDAYYRLPPSVQAKTGIAFGLLTSLVDAMYAANDPRLSQTIGSLDAFKGPICHYHVESYYATDPRTIAHVERIRERIRVAGGRCP